jgi:hypothetical protein
MVTRHRETDTAPAVDSVRTKEGTESAELRRSADDKARRAGISSGDSPKPHGDKLGKAVRASDEDAPGAVEDEP